MSEFPETTPADDNLSTIPLPVPKPSHSKASIAPNTPSLQTLKSWLPLYLMRTDAQINHLSRILSTPSGTDTLLQTIGYTSLLTSTVLSSISLRRLRNTVRDIIENAISLPPNTTVIIDASSTIPTSRLLLTAQCLKTLYSLISDFRIFARLWGLIGIWQWGKGVLTEPSKDGMTRQITYLQVLVNVFYQYLENGAYLSSKGVMGWSTDKQNRAWVWSSRFWMAHVGLDLIRLGREYVMREEGRTKDEKRNDDSGSDVLIIVGESEWKSNWRREMLVNLAYAPLTAHWSLEQGLMGDFWVGLLGSVAGVAKFTELWKGVR